MEVGKHNCMASDPWPIFCPQFDQIGSFAPMSRRLNRESCPCKSQGPPGTRTNYASTVPLFFLGYGSECKLFHVVSSCAIHCIEHWLLVHYHPFVVSVYTCNNVETTRDKRVVWEASMYVQTYLDLSHREVSCCFCLLFFPWLVQLGAWLGGSWLPWRAAPWLLLLVVCLFVIKRLLY